MKPFFSGLIFLLCLTGCMAEPLTVRMDYISHENLASSYVNTPDPLLENPLVGQRLIVSWWLPLQYKECQDFELRIKLRYGNREEAETAFSFSKRQGWYVYSLTNEEYFEKSGIKTYYVELFADGELIDRWQHQLWVTLVEFEEIPSQDTDEDFSYDEDDEDDLNDD